MVIAVILYLNKYDIIYGYDVKPIILPAKALDVAENHEGTIHLMLTDVVMPDMDGKARFETLALTRPELKVVFMSGYTENIIARKGGLKEGIGINFIQEPFSTRQLAGKPGAVLGCCPL